MHDQNVCKKIVSFLPDDTTRLLEVGPGGGALTKYLLEQHTLELKCVEFDKEKVEYLISAYPVLKEKLIHADFLNIEAPFDGRFTVIGNFPYNISSQIVFKIIDWREQVPIVIGMFQKELAMRIAAKHGNKDYGILSVLTQCFYDVEFLLEVHENCFVPPPKVKSAVIRMARKNDLIQEGDFKSFKTFVKAAFGQRRKTLRNALKSVCTPDFLQAAIFNQRAEQLSVTEFVDLFQQHRSYK